MIQEFFEFELEVMKKLFYSTLFSITLLIVFSISNQLHTPILSILASAQVAPNYWKGKLKATVIRSTVEGTGNIYSIAVNSKGYAAISYGQGVTRILDLSSKKFVRELKDWGELIFSPDNSLLVIDGNIWDWQSGKLLYSHSSRSVMHPRAFSPDSKTVFFGDSENSIPSRGREATLVDWKTGKFSTTVYGGYIEVYRSEDPVNPITVISPNRTLPRQESEGQFDFIDLNSGKVITTLKLDLNNKNKRSFIKEICTFDSKDQDFIHVGITEVTRFRGSLGIIPEEMSEIDIQIWNWRVGKMVSHFKLDIASRRGSPVFSPDRKTIALYTSQGIQLIDSFNGLLLRTIPTSGDSWSKFSHDGKKLLVVTAESVDHPTLKIWEALP